MLLRGLLPGFFQTPPLSPPSSFPQALQSESADWQPSLECAGGQGAVPFVLLESALPSATRGDRVPYLRVVIRFLAGSSSSEAQTHPSPEGVALDSSVPVPVLVG